MLVEEFLVFRVVLVFFQVPDGLQSGLSLLLLPRAQLLERFLEVVLVESLTGLALFGLHVFGHELVVSFPSLHFAFAFPILAALEEDGSGELAEEVDVAAVVVGLVAFFLILAL